MAPNGVTASLNGIHPRGVGGAFNLTAAASGDKQNNNDLQSSGKKRKLEVKVFLKFSVSFYSLAKFFVLVLEAKA